MNRGITELSVDRLFGRYDYRLHLAKEDDADPPRMSLLYGDNGSGKTTILELVYHLLSAADGRGHKSYVANVPFQRFSVLLSDQTRVTATRSSDEIIGGFDLELTHSVDNTQSARFDVDRDGDVTAESLSPDAMALIASMSGLDLNIFYLRDDRNLESDTFPIDDLTRDITQEVRRDPNTGALRTSRHRGPGGFEPRRILDHRELVLLWSIFRAERQLNREAIRASSLGETEAWQSQREILRTIATTSAPDADELIGEVVRIHRELADLQRITENFGKFGLGSVINAESLSDILSSANPTTLPVVVAVLDSVIDGQRVRLNALNFILKKVDRFVGIVNQYLADKVVEFDALEGLSIRLPQSTLDPNLLSSGEKNILLLFLNVFLSSGQSPLFIIDEPELSLNVKWQRRLVDSLLEISEDYYCQFLLATHSIELLSKHRDYVVRVGSIDG